MDGPERFKPPGGFVSFDMDIPDGMLEESGPPENIGIDMLEKEDTVGHIALMEHQLTRARSSLQTFTLKDDSFPSRRARRDGLRVGACCRWAWPCR